jgi:predicted kinase
MQKILTIIRGLPGSGKSSYAESIRGNNPVCSADDFFTVNGVYTFDGSKLGMAHADCQSRVNAVLYHRDSSVIVANTFTQRWEMEQYLVMAKYNNARVVVIDCFDGGMDDETLAQKNVHGVPLESIRAMRARWEHDWRAASPIAPWLRNK